MNCAEGTPAETFGSIKQNGKIKKVIRAVDFCDLSYFARKQKNCPALLIQFSVPGSYYSLRLRNKSLPFVLCIAVYHHIQKHLKKHSQLFARLHSQ